MNNSLQESFQTMEVNTVNNLLQLRACSTSDFSQSELSGIISIVTSQNGSHERGTVLLADPTTGELVPCFTDIFFPKINGQHIQIRKWNYIYNELAGISMLEFKLDQVYQIGSDVSVQQQSLNEDDTWNEITIRKKVPFHTIDESLSIDNPKSVNIAGVVESISSLYVKPSSPATFYIQLTDVPENSTNKERLAVTIKFSKDELIKYYHLFQVGFIYTFQNLKLVSDKSPENTSRKNKSSKHVLSFKEDSICNTLRYHQYLQGFQKYKPAQESTKYSLTLSRLAKKTISYEGCITRVIDSLFGIYELDNKFVLCLFYYLGYSPSRPYRVQARIKLHHVHVALIDTNQDNHSHLFQTLWNAPKAALEDNTNTTRYHVILGCMKSHVSIISFPNHCKYVEMSYLAVGACNNDEQNDDELEATEFKQQMYLHCLEHGFNFEQLIRQLELYAALVVKFSSIVRNSSSLMKAHQIIRRHVFGSKVKPAFAQSGNIANDFFLHQDCCSAVGNLDQDIYVSIEAYPDMNQVQRLLKANLEESNINLAGSNSMFGLSNVLTRTAKYDQREDYYIMGVVRMGNDGRLYMLDNTSRIIFTVPINAPKIVHSGAIYFVRKAHLISEDLSYVDEDSSEFYSLESTYLACDNLTLADLPYRKQKLAFSMDAVLENSKHSIKNFTIRSLQELQHNHIQNDTQYVCAQVISSTSAQAHITNDGNVHLCVEVKAKLYAIDNLGIQSESTFFDSTSTAKEEKYHLILLTSYGKTMHYSKEFQAGKWVVISGLDKSSPGNSFALNDHDHGVYPIAILGQSYNNNTVRLTSVLDATTRNKPDPSKAVYPVSNFTVPRALPQDVFQEKTQSYFFTKTINVRGILVKKTFTDGLSTASIYANYAKQLYTHLGVSTGKPNRKLYLQLRQPDGLQVLDIYVDVRRRQYPLGLLVGSTIVVRNLIRKPKRGSDTKFFCLAEDCTTFEVERFATSDADRIGPDLILADTTPVRLISQFPRSTLYFEEDETIYKILCRIQSIIALEMKWECRNCGSVVVNDQCYGMCQVASRAFSASAFVQFSDGTGTANASVDGERLVFRMLQLPPVQIDALKRVILSHGKIGYGGWGRAQVTTIDDVDQADFNKQQKREMHGYTVEDLCNRAKQTDFWLYGKKNISTGAEKKSILLDTRADDEVVTTFSLEQLGLRTINISDNDSNLKTVELSKYRFKVLELEPSDESLDVYTQFQDLVSLMAEERKSLAIGES